MKNKFILCFIIFLTVFITISTTSANENLNNSVSYDDDMLQDVFEVNKSSTNFSSNNISSFNNFNDTLTVKLTSNKTPLANKQIQIILNNLTYNKTTDSNGFASIDFKLKTGNYTVFYSFSGDENYTSSNASSTITVKDSMVVILKVVDNDNYFEDSKSLFQVKLIDNSSNVICGENVYVRLNQITYVSKTNSKGIASFYFKLKKGRYTVKCSFSNTGKYLSSYTSFKINVKPKLTNGYGYWVNKWDMKKVNLKKLYKLGTKHIFIDHTAISYHGKTTVLKWIKKAHKYGIKVHLWMAVFHKNGKFINAASKNGKYNYKFINNIIKKAKSYSKLSDIDGIHFDYIRYGGDAYRYKNGVEAINYFVKKACNSIHKINPFCIVSAAVMPEPNIMKYYYGQDISYMSKYFDVLIPMMYKGNYHASSNWIKKNTKIFVKKSYGAKIWTGLQSYKSDRNVKKLSYSALLKDVKAAKKCDAAGIVLFRWGLSQLINFKKV